MRIIFLALAFPVLIQASEIKNVQFYLKDINVLGKDILKIEKVLDGKISGQEREKVENLRKNLTELKVHARELNNSSGLDEAIAISNQNQWTNTSTFLYRVKNACVNVESMQNECFIQLASFDPFISKKLIPEDIKLKFSQLVDDYGKHTEAKILINDEFIKSTDELLVNTQTVLSEAEKPLAVITMTPVHVNGKKISSSIQPPSKQENKTSPVKFNKTYLFSFIGGLAFLSFALVGMKQLSKRKIKKDIAKFYSGIFFVTQKQRMNTKVFGKIKANNVDKLKRIDTIYFDLLGSSSILDSDVNVRIKNKEKKLILEMEIYSEKPLQDYLAIETYSNLNEKLDVVEKQVLGIGGDLQLANYFDNQGKFTNSCLIVVI